MRIFLLIPLIVVLTLVNSVVAQQQPVQQQQQQAMSRELINSFFAASTELAQLKQYFPEIQKLSSAQQTDSSESLIALLQASEAYPEIKNILKNSQFAELSDFLLFSQRLLAMQLQLQMKYSDQANIFQTVKILAANLNTMRANKASESIIKQAEALLAEQTAKAQVIQSALDKLTQQDQQFVEQNHQWLIQRFAN